MDKCNSCTSVTLGRIDCRLSGVGESDGLRLLRIKVAPVLVGAVGDIEEKSRAAAKASVTPKIR